MKTSQLYLYLSIFLPKISLVKATPLKESLTKVSVVLIVLFLAIPYSLSAAAQTVYISNEDYVPVRKGQGSQFSILHRGLPTGTQVTLIENDSDWAKIRTNGGITGWVRSQYINKTPPARIRLANLQNKMTSLQSKLESISQEKTEIQKALTDTQNLLTKSEESNKKTKNELNSIKSISASAIESHQKLQSLAEKMQLLQTENDILKSENESLSRSERTTFFLYGAFAVIIGVVIALIVPRLRAKKRNDGWLN
jgi:SH3 domain protein